jgi:hypothetical protein
VRDFESATEEIRFFFLEGERTMLHKFATLMLVLSVGSFAALGCGPTAKKEEKKTTTTTTTTTKPDAHKDHDHSKDASEAKKAGEDALKKAEDDAAKAKEAADKAAADAIKKASDDASKKIEDATKAVEDAVKKPEEK